MIGCLPARLTAVCVVATVALTQPQAAASEGPGLKTHIEALRAVGPEGASNEAAAAAWKELATAPASSLPEVLRGLNGANPLAQNWLRAAAGAIADRAQAAHQPVPVDELLAFLQNTENTPGARSLAWDLIRAADPARAHALTMDFLEDPAAELRRPAVTRLVEQAQQLVAAGQKDAALPVAEKAFRAARDEDLITRSVDILKELERPPDIASHLGLILDWQLLAPFSNTKRAGFDTIFPPEEKLDLHASYPLPDGSKISWQPFRSTDPYGQIDFNKPFGLLKEAVGYAATTVDSPEARDAELRIGTGNAWKVWLNGRFLFGRDEYHRGARLDQYSLPVRLEKGPNTLLVKVCQNEETETWTVEWRFQLRLCDSTGSALAASQ